MYEISNAIIKTIKGWTYIYTLYNEIFFNKDGKDEKDAMR
jgi:hypothetical protein